MEITLNIFQIILFNCLFLAFSGVFFAENSMHAILFLILAFVVSANYLILLQQEFLALLFLIIYVGAIAVLFLFVIIMLNLKIYPNVAANFFIVGSTFIFSGILYFFFDVNFIPFYNTYFFDSILEYDSLSNILVVGQMLYNGYLILVLLAGLVLLLALVGALVLTITFNTSKVSDSNVSHSLDTTLLKVYTFND